MAAKSRIEKYKKEIINLLDRGASIRSTWKIVNSTIHEDGKISYNAFLHFIKRNCK